MKPSRLLVIASTVLALALGAAPGALASTTQPPVAPVLHTSVVTTFPFEEFPDWGAFAESMVMAPDGTLYVSVTAFKAVGWNRGQVWRIAVDGTRTPFGPQFDVGILSGLALDARGHLYAGVITWEDPALPPLPSGVVRISASSATPVLTLPADGAAHFPNGLAFHDGWLYVSDSMAGAIWRTRPRAGVVDVPVRPWLTSPRLAPTAGWEGVNGITFRGDQLYAVVADVGGVLRAGVSRSGAAGPLVEVARDELLVDADGIAFDASGALWVAANRAAVAGGGALVTVSARGRVDLVAENVPWLNYPTQPVFGTTRSTRGALFLANGGLNSERPADVVRVAVCFPRHHGPR